VTKLKKTNRKFYNKWLYKVTIQLEGAGAFRLYSLSDLKEICLDQDRDSWLPSFLKDVVGKNKQVIIDLIILLETFDSTKWAKRIERNCIDFYTSDKNIYEEILANFDHKITQHFEPDVDSLDLLKSSCTILGKKLPHGKYQFRVYLQPHKLAGDKEAKRNYIKWLKTQIPRITLTTAVENWFYKTDWNWDRRYILVEDDKTLLMLKLRNSEVMGKVYNYQVSDK